MDFIVITGGPCGGKTTFLAKAQQHLVSRGLLPLIIPESATVLQLAGFPRQGNAWTDDLDFQREVLLETLEREAEWLRRAGKLRTNRRKVILCDRGLFDIAAYVGKETCERLLAEQGLSPAEVLKRYRMVVHLVTAADGAEEHYTLENNTARTETLEEARALDKRTQRAWWGHPNLAIIGNETGFDMKFQRAFQSLSRVLHFGPVFPVEKERAFRLREFHFSMLPADAVRRDITQTYLVPHSDSERRLRMETVHGVTTYTYTRKIGRKASGKRDEISRIISLPDYEDMFHEVDVELKQIVKTRYSFTWGNRHFELDDFHGPVSPLYLVEVEGVELNEKIEFPPEWGELEEVTAKKEFGNYAIARDLLQNVAA